MDPSRSLWTPYGFITFFMDSLWIHHVLYGLLMDPSRFIWTAYGSITFFMDFRNVDAKIQYRTVARLMRKLKPNANANAEAQKYLSTSQEEMGKTKRAQGR